MYVLLKQFYQSMFPDNRGFIIFLSIYLFIMYIIKLLYEKHFIFSSVKERHSSKSVDIEFQGNSLLYDDVASKGL